MKQNFLFLGVLAYSLFFTVNVTRAEIIKHYGQERELTAVRSTIQDLDVFSRVDFFAQENQVSLYFSRMGDSWLLPERRGGQLRYGRMTIDAQPHNMPVLDTEIEVWKGNRLHSKTGYDLTALVGQIKNAGKIELILYYSKQPTVEFNLPQYLLDEWKEVLTLFSQGRGLGIN